MPYCITCGKLEAEEKLRRVGTLKRKKANDFPDIKFRITGWSHKRIGIIQYIKCKLAGHRCYL